MKNGLKEVLLYSTKGLFIISLNLLGGLFLMLALGNFSLVFNVNEGSLIDHFINEAIFIYFFLTITIII